MSRGFPLQDTGPGMNELFHDLSADQEKERAGNMEAKETLADKPCGALADWILGYLANECSLDMGCVSPADFLAITNAIHNHELDIKAALKTAQGKHDDIQS